MPPQYPKRNVVPRVALETEFETMRQLINVHPYPNTLLPLMTRVCNDYQLVLKTCVGGYRRNCQLYLIDYPS